MLYAIKHKGDFQMEGYNNKILHVDLSTGLTEVEEPGLDFYRKYMGGSSIGTYYCLKSIPAGTAPLDPENILAISASIITGAPVPFLSRFSINAKSPLTGGIGDSQGGGWFGPELKNAGFDAVIITGRAETPKYLWIHNQEVEIRDANDVWGLDIGETETVLREQVGEKNARLLCIGKAGENLVSYACVINENRHANGRTGMGAVMGSKNLKAVVVKGQGKLSFFDKSKLVDISREEATIIKEDEGFQALSQFGTNDGWMFQNEMGGLPTHNFKESNMENPEKLTAEEFHDLYYKNETCYACPVKCKIALKLENPAEGQYTIDPKYGGPEYETVSSFGSYLGITDKYVIAKAHELCNRYTIDTISLGGSIAFAMECFEAGLLTKNDTDGLELVFGNSDVLLPAVEMVANNEGFGSFLAQGPKEMAKQLGKGSEKFAMEVKGNPMPAHMARHKNAFALMYAVNPYGADHCSCFEDFEYMDTLPEEDRTICRQLDLNDFCPFEGLPVEKVRMVLYSNMYLGFIDALGICVFSTFFYNPKRIIKIIEGATGWETSLFELMKVGERKTMMMRFFNFKHGLTVADDRLPNRLFEELPSGATKGRCIDKIEFTQRIADYYDMAGLDAATGAPTRGKLLELGLNWLAESSES